MYAVYCTVNSWNDHVQCQGLSQTHAHTVLYRARSCGGPSVSLGNFLTPVPHRYIIRYHSPTETSPGTMHNGVFLYAIACCRSSVLFLTKEDSNCICSYHTYRSASVLYYVYGGAWGKILPVNRGTTPVRAL